MNIACPYCGSNMTIRSSKPVSIVSKELWLQCKSFECGFSCHAMVQIDRVVSPSSVEKKSIDRLLDQKGRSKKRHGEFCQIGETTVSDVITALNEFPLDVPAHMLFGTTRNPEVIRIGRVIGYSTPLEGFCVAIKPIGGAE